MVITLAAAAGMALALWLRQPASLVSWLLPLGEVVVLGTFFAYTYRRMRAIETEMRDQGRAHH
jgi:hypothetical protein